MRNPELYERTVNILVDAYFKDSLQALNCRACAVTNLIAANLSIDFVLAGYDHGGAHGRLPTKQPSVRTDELTEWFRIPHLTTFDFFGVTGYSLEDLLDIETVFIRAETGGSEDEYHFNGLMAIIDYLDSIHENTDTLITETSKNKFKREQTLTV